ncbi:MAG: DUF547 domain-containing protein [Hyphomicrobiaceae bacterium]|nr:DUF547 domain-containing protein [Hyphomicrobiaceae bacterium]
MTPQRNRAGRYAIHLQDWNRYMFRIATATAIAVFLMFVAVQNAQSEELRDRFAPHDPASKVTVDHSAWNKLLARHLHVGEDGLNRFDYAGLKKDGLADLKKYLDRLQAVKPEKLNRNEQFAFWTNLYNAKTVDVVAAHYPVKSIRDIRLTSFLFPGPWKEDVVKVSGADLSLDDIEHEIMRPIWRDPRIHYAVNCASVGCPNLLKEAYTGATLDTMLDRAARGYINSPRGVRFDGKDIVASSLFDWYASDFGGSSRRILVHIRKYAEPVLADRLAGATSISDYEYDWALNDKK